MFFIYRTSKIVFIYRECNITYWIKVLFPLRSTRENKSDTKALHLKDHNFRGYVKFVSNWFCGRDFMGNLCYSLFSFSWFCFI